MKQPLERKAGTKRHKSRRYCWWCGTTIRLTKHHERNGRGPAVIIILCRRHHELIERYRSIMSNAHYWSEEPLLQALDEVMPRYRRTWRSPCNHRPFMRCPECKNLIIIKDWLLIKKVPSLGPYCDGCGTAVFASNGQPRGWAEDDNIVTFGETISNVVMNYKSG